MNVDLGGTEIEVDVASTPTELYEGLSSKESIGDREGMLFDWPAEKRHGLVMRDMSFPIDAIFLSEAGEVVQTETLERDGEEVRARSAYALEVPAGFCEKHEIEVGDTASFEIVRNMAKRRSRGIEHFSTKQQRGPVVWNNVGGDPFGDYDVLESFCEDLEEEGAEVLLGDEPWEHASGHHDRPVKAFGITLEDAEAVWSEYEEEAIAIGGPKKKSSPEVKEVEAKEGSYEKDGMAFVHRNADGVGSILLKQDDGDDGGWIPYEGPQGGTGWEHTDRDERVYPDKPPGPTAEYVNEGQVLEGVTDLNDLTPGDDIKVGDEIYEVTGVQEGPGGQTYSRVEHEGMEFTVTQDLVEAQVLGEALETGDYDVDRDTYGGTLAEALVKGQMNEKGTDGFQNVRRLQHNLGEVENETLLLDVLTHEAENRNSKTAVGRIKSRLSALDVPESRIKDAMPGGGVDMGDLDNVVIEELDEGQEVVLDPTRYPGINEPIEGTVYEIQTGDYMGGIYVEPDNEVGLFDEGQTVEINGEDYYVDRLYTDDEGNVDPSFEDAETREPLMGDDYPEFDDFEEEATIVDDPTGDYVPVQLDDAEEELFYQQGTRPDNPYPVPGYSSATEEFKQEPLYRGFGVKQGIEGRETLERVSKHATDEELREISEEAQKPPSESDVAPNKGRAAKAILYKRGEGSIYQTANFDFDNSGLADATRDEVVESTEKTFDKVDTVTAAALAAHTSEIKMDSYSALGKYSPSSRKITIDGMGNWSEDTVAHELGHSLHYLVGFSGNSSRDNTENSSSDDYSFTVDSGAISDERSEQFVNEFRDFVDEFEDNINEDYYHQYALREYQTTNSNEIFSVAFGQWVDDPSKLKNKQPELYEMFNEYFGNEEDN